jgi:hypothetical protein
MPVPWDLCHRARGTVVWEPRADPKIIEKIDEFARDRCSFVSPFCIEASPLRGHHNLYASASKDGAPGDRTQHGKPAMQGGLLLSD